MERRRYLLWKRKKKNEAERKRGEQKREAKIQC